MQAFKPCSCKKQRLLKFKIAPKLANFNHTSIKKRYNSNRLPLTVHNPPISKILNLVKLNKNNRLPTHRPMFMPKKHLSPCAKMAAEKKQNHSMPMQLSKPMFMPKKHLSPCSRKHQSLTHPKFQLKQVLDTSLNQHSKNKMKKKISRNKQKLKFIKKLIANYIDSEKHQESMSELHKKTKKSKKKKSKKQRFK